MGVDSHLTKKDARKMLASWPRAYPALISIRDLSFECATVYVDAAY